MHIQADRLFIRPFDALDISNRYLSWLNDPVTMQYSNQRFNTHTYDSATNYLDSFRHSQNKFLAITERSSGLLIGTFTIYYSTFHRTADLGLLIGDKTFQRSGFGFEAWSCVLQDLSVNSHVRKITGGTLRPNCGMVRIMEKSLMKLEAVRSLHEVVNDEPVDLLYFSFFTGL